MAKAIRSTGQRGNMALGSLRFQETDSREKKMAAQEQQQPQSRETETEVDVPEAPPAAPEAQASDATQGVDDLLDEIDGVLESNAEEFVRAFVQKGGQ